jgi:hypothetical protein
LGHGLADREELPATTEFAEDGDDCIAFGENSIAIYQHQGLDIAGVEAMLAIELLPKWGLDGGEFKDLLSIDLNYHLHGTIAEVADSIKQN